MCVCEALVSYVQIQCVFQFASYNLTFYNIAVMVIGGGWLDCSDFPIALFQLGSPILFVLKSIYKIFAIETTKMWITLYQKYATLQLSHT